VVGVLYPMTAPAAQIGIDHRHAVEVAIDVVNNRHENVDLPLGKSEGLPGLGGAKIRAIFADHQGKPEVGQGEAQRLITQQRVHVLVGAWHSSVTATTSQVAERFGIPFVNTESSSPLSCPGGPIKGLYAGYPLAPLSSLPTCLPDRAPQRLPRSDATPTPVARPPGSPAHPSQASAQASALPRHQRFFLTGSSSALYRVSEDR